MSIADIYETYYLLEWHITRINSSQRWAFSVWYALWDDIKNREQTQNWKRRIVFLSHYASLMAVSEGEKKKVDSFRNPREKIQLNNETLPG